ncbi:phage terminase, large subunit, PBSX family,phage terminase, large subunit, PBSX family,Terminase-like family [[Clostridium] sordellii]|uniref:PBSX family phage terminase large subunit n=1 Tax=Paraclostridium sordellii TaxID=1505 RepID=UPI0005424256|nr:phage terminase, large subunit, PBSX family,phage terminase, large subunit, PBSX family,Terminase-like family [[Clostridium] sordellii] [Paeniclostridium sordellii]
MIKDRISNLKEKVAKMKTNRGLGRVKKATIKFSPFSKKQKKVLTWWLSNSPVSDKDGIIADGAIRSGKTISMSLSFAIWAMSSFNGQNFGMCGKTIGSFRRNVLFWLKLMLKARKYKVEDKRADNLVIVSKGEVTNYFYIFGGKDERSQDLIQGITLAGIFFDEVALMPESFVNQATGRCSVEGSKFWFNCNPDGPYHWFNINWIEKRDEKNILYLHFTMDDNLSLSEQIKKRYRSMYSGVFYDRYIKGLWKIADGVIYSMFDKEKHIVKAYDYQYKEYYISCDYGTQNATVFGLWGKVNDNLHIMMKEYYYSGRDTGIQKTDLEYAIDLKEFTKGYNIKYVIVDPSAASFIAQLRKEGFKVIKAKNAVIDGIRLVASLLNQFKILFDESCEETFKEFGSYVWDIEACKKGEDEVKKEHDHSMDQIRYYCSTVIKNKKPKRTLRR